MRLYGQPIRQVTLHPPNWLNSAVIVEHRQSNTLLLWIVTLTVVYVWLYEWKTTRKHFALYSLH